jgi:hypothetical protein
MKMRHEISQGVFYDQASSSCPNIINVLCAVTSLVCYKHAGTSEIVCLFTAYTEEEYILDVQ